ncbi:MAG: reverse transcriptase family protein [Kiritimatiellae bacterium]|nr:reverse transcriptase family protein [Kiritimatiellia bacterium]
MRIVKIPKRQGTFRTLYVPSRREREAIRRLLPDIRTEAHTRCQPDVVHGFLPSRSPVTNAEMHIGWRYTLSFDLADFFDHVSSTTLARADFLPTPIERQILMPGDRARQGLATSPFLANIAGSALDTAILFDIRSIGMPIIYTRYADDLDFSYDDAHVTTMLTFRIPLICTQAGFPINPTKTRLHSALSGRRIICGVAVDNSGLLPTRRTKRRLRAALHQGHTRQAAGLREWMRLKSPRSRYDTRDSSPSPSLPTPQQTSHSVRPPALPRQYAFDEP